MQYIEISIRFRKKKILSTRGSFDGDFKNSDLEMGILRMESILKPEWKVIYEQTELDNDNFQTFESDKARNSRNPFLNYNL